MTITVPGVGRRKYDVSASASPELDSSSSFDEARVRGTAASALASQISRWDANRDMEHASSIAAARGI